MKANLFRKLNTTLQLVVSVLILYACTTAYSADRCFLVLSNNDIGNKYSIHLKGESLVRRVKYVRSIEQNNQVVLEFNEFKGKKKTVKLKVPTEDITYWQDITLLPKDFNALNYLIEFTKSFFLAPKMWHDTVKTYFIPHRKLLEKGSIRVDGQFRSSKKTAEKVVETLSEFDLHVAELGFKTPYFTKVLLTDHPILPGTGPSFSYFPTFSFRRLAASHSIKLDPMAYDVSIAIDPQVLRHERTHSFLFSSYLTESFVNNSASVREALADFFTANASGSPHIGPPNRLVRNIETMESKNVVIRSVVNIEGIDFHDASMLLSNLLWRVRQKVGVATLNPLLKPLLNNFNSMGGARNMGLNSTQNVISEYEYLGAVLLKTAQQHGVYDPVREAVVDSMNDFKVNQERVFSLVNELVDSGDPMIRKKVKMMEVMTGYLAAGFFLTIEAMAVYALLDSVMP